MASIGETFFEQTRYRYLGPSEQQQGIDQPALERRLTGRVDAPPTPLPEAEGIADELATRPLRASISARRSIRKYADDAIRLEELSLLLWGTQGVQNVIPDRATFRTVPSAGSRHPFETVLLINRVESIRPGLYQYLALSHQLAPLSHEADLVERFTTTCHHQPCVAHCAALFIWIADVRRTTWRYGERGYRYILIDAGHVCQNLYLLGEALDIGICAVGAFTDEEASELIGVDGAELMPVYIATAGRKKPPG
jgi:SagB-type dehydrogenase family enzyme